MKNLICSWALFIFFSATFFSTTVGVMNSVDAPQFALVRAIVDERTTKINSFVDYVNPDFALYRGNVFTDREPGLPFMVLPFYVLAKVLQPWAKPPYNNFHHLGVTSDSPLEVLTYGFSASLSALGIVMFYLVSRKLKFSQFSSLTGALSLGLGTLILKYSAGMVRQPVIIFLFMLVFWIYLAIDGKKKSVPCFFYFGLILALIFITDHLSVFTLFIFGVVFFRRIWKLSSGHFDLVFWKRMGIVVLGAMIPIGFFLFYNFVSFGKIFVTPRNFTNLKGLEKAENIMIGDLRKTVPVNLWSNGPIDEGVFSYFDGYPELQKLFFSANEWASKTTYRGIFVQSPILLIAVCGLFFLNRGRAFLLLALFLSYFLPASKILVFYAPTAIDGRYVFPSIVFLFLGLPAFLDFVFKKPLFLRMFLLLACFYLMMISFSNAVLSLVLHFAPHVTGEHRFYYENFPTSIFWVKDASRFWSNVFPNVYNLHLMGVVLIFFSAVYFFVKKVKAAILLKKPW